MKPLHTRFWSQDTRNFLRFGFCIWLVGCGNWVGNPKPTDDDDNAGTGTSIAEPGDMMLHRVQVAAGESTQLHYKIGGAAALLAGNEQAFEVSVVNAAGEEKVYTRQAAGESGVSFTAEEEGAYTVLIKNNSSTDAEMVVTEASGVATDEGLINATSAGTGTHKDIVLKAVITFARQCKVYVNNGASTQTYTAPEGSYYIQPFVFLGQVNSETKQVTPISTAQITVSSGTTSMTLKKLADFDLGVFREHGALTKDQHVVYTRNFYSGYFGAAGELYTTDTFRFGGDCASAPTFAAPTDVGTADIQLRIQDASLSPALDASHPIRPTISTAFTMYEKEGQKLDNWDPCTYDAFTAIPYNYNDATQPCRKLSILDAPYITLDYLLPSEASADSLTKASDPTRILFYGHSFARSFKKAIIDNQEALRGDLSTLSLDRCVNNGGMHAVPLGVNKTYLPLGEFNTQSGDLIQLARKTGSYTALTDFYQGNVSLDGSVDYAACIPNSGTQSSCDEYKVIAVEVTGCRIKADSGISASSISDSFIYPEYYEMSGEVVE
ncbi:MAG TPA: emp24/gp25L/p24 family protein [Oligoflexus sp.]|uniref:emp24/gp25L/p24 family protein n=1 Tax=Oligoflexus sp. TaxID=1971216 RepID=UPI002D548FDE|nr:emp24/gp25L/p24 family protein [Oligoflexus sp.]HYX37800.1 emp24/gp25L/p24 family protein [Oligoflexus sp.]